MNAPETPHFDEPWHAQSFALTVASVEAGVFSWAEWTQAFSVRRGREAAAEDASDYYDDWTATLEALLVREGVAAPAAIEATASAWVRATRATPHGHPIVLENDPER